MAGLVKFERLSMSHRAYLERFALSKRIQDLIGNIDWDKVFKPRVRVKMGRRVV